MSKKLRTNSEKNLIGNTFRDKPERINRKGRPPKLIHHIVDELKQQGYQPVKESQIVDAYQMLLQLPEEQIKEMTLDKSKPYFIRLVAKWMGEKRGMEMLDRIMDRSFGKVMMRQVIDSNVTVKPTIEASGDRDSLVKEVMGKLDPTDISVINQSSIDEQEEGK